MYSCYIKNGALRSGHFYAIIKEYVCDFNTGFLIISIRGNKLAYFSFYLRLNNVS